MITMARVDTSALLDTTHGRIGEVVVKHYKYGKVMTRVPRMDHIIPSEKQLLNRQRWREGAAYYQLVKASPELCLCYAGKVQETGYALSAITNRDFFNPPTVSKIDFCGFNGAAGSKIRIHAHDDFAVVAMDVTLRDATGAVIESGPAYVEANDVWFYPVHNAIGLKTPFTVEAVAKDMPGNRGTLTKSWLVPPSP
jgi:hypothetical protein